MRPVGAEPIGIGRLMRTDSETYWRRREYKQGGLVRPGEFYRPN